MKSGFERPMTILSRLRPEQVVTAALALLGVAIAIGGLRLRVGYIYAPGPGFFPFLAGLAITIFSCAYLLVGGHGDATEDTTSAGIRAAILPAALVVYTLVLEQVGFIVSTALLSIVLLRLTYPQRWFMTIFISIGAAVLTFVIFTRLLKVDLPFGSLLRD